MGYCIVTSWKEGRKEGSKEGKKDGRKEGRKEGRKDDLRVQKFSYLL